MPQKHLHIVAFNIPFPPDYGGVIDIFYKIRHLHQQGVKIILHCFEYDRSPAGILKKYCENVYYYKRNISFITHFSFRPYIINSRKSDKLLTSLKSDPYPILFEGLHSCYYLSHPCLNDKMKIVRMHNIEHQYYLKLASGEKKILSKLFFYIESFKLRFALKELHHADEIAGISRSDCNYLLKKFSNTFYLPAFHSNDQISIKKGKGDYILYHGNLGVSENYQAAIFLLKKVFSKINFRFVIAGKDPDPAITELVEKNDNIELINSPDNDVMKNLIREAHANILITFQNTGMKLKLLESLFSGRFCIANNQMINNTGLESLCERANTAGELIVKINKILTFEFNDERIRERELILERYKNQNSIQLLTEII